MVLRGRGAAREEQDGGALPFGGFGRGRGMTKTSIAVARCWRQQWH
jgi:hypothetical protein